MALFPIQRPFSTNWLAVYLKEKGKCLPHTLKQKYRHYFLTSSRPWHALHIAYFGSVILTYLPQDSVQKSLFFCILSIIPETRTLFCPLLLSCVHTYILYCMFESLRPKARLHLNTSWKTRHLVFSHITSENSWSSPYVHSKNLHLLQFTKTWSWKLGSSPTVTHSIVLYFSLKWHFVTLLTVFVRCSGRKVEIKLFF